MALIGIIVNKDNIIEEVLKKKKIKNHNILVIPEERVLNFKNIKFDVIVVYGKIKYTESVKKTIINSNYLILNTDFKENLRLLEDEERPYVVTYGFNGKATVTIISNENSEIILDIQREIENIDKGKIECQEIKLEQEYGKKHIYEEISLKIFEKIAKI